MSDRRFLGRLTAALVIISASFTLVVPVGAQEQPPTSAAPDNTAPDNTAPVITAPHIIPLPNSGSEPVREGDRGSTTQIAVLFGTMGAMVLVVLLVMRESKKKQRQQRDR